MIRVQGLWHHYDIRPVLKDVSLDVATGELVVLLGPNGMGKSTLLGCLAGVHWPQRGSVEFDGVRRRQSVHEERKLRKRIAYLPETVWLPERLTVREYLIAVGKLYDIDSLRLFDHVDRLVDLFHLSDKEDTLLLTLSTGQRKKVALASALVTDAPYLLLDEPFSGGIDPAAMLALKRVLRWLVEERDVTVVMTTPSPDVIEAIADRVAVLRDGSVSAYAKPADLQSQGGDASLEVTLVKLMYPEDATGVADYFNDRPDAGDTVI